MKKLFFFCAIAFLPLLSISQAINNFSVWPSSPQPADTIYVYVNCTFPNSGCDDKTQSMFVSGNTISAYALHCMGMLTVLCNSTDTFKINPLPAGNYTFIFQVDAGQGPSPCTPGIAPGPVDSVSIHVAASTGIVQQPGHANGLQMLQGTKTGSFICRMPSVTHWPVTINIYNSVGKRILSPVISTNNQEVDLSSLGAGVYVVTSDDIQIAGVKIRIE